MMKKIVIYTTLILGFCTGLLYFARINADESVLKETITFDGGRVVVVKDVYYTKAYDYPSLRLTVKKNGKKYNVLLCNGFEATKIEWKSGKVKVSLHNTNLSDEGYLYVSDLKNCSVTVE